MASLPKVVAILKFAGHAIRDRDGFLRGFQEFEQLSRLSDKSADKGDHERPPFFARTSCRRAVSPLTGRPDLSSTIHAYWQGENGRRRAPPVASPNSVAQRPRSSLDCRLRRDPF